MQIPSEATWREDLAWGAAVALCVPFVALALAAYLIARLFDAITDALTSAALAVAGRVAGWRR